MIKSKENIVVFEHEIIRFDRGDKKITKDDTGPKRFVLVDEEMSQENELSIIDDLVMQAYDNMKVLAGKPEKWFGLDGSVVTHEMVPVIIKPRSTVKLQRI